MVIPLCWRRVAEGQWGKQKIAEKDRQDQGGRRGRTGCIRLLYANISLCKQLLSDEIFVGVVWKWRLGRRLRQCSQKPTCLVVKDALGRANLCSTPRAASYISLGQWNVRRTFVHHPPATLWDFTEWLHRCLSRTRTKAPLLATLDVHLVHVQEWTISRPLLSRIYSFALFPGFYVD